MIKQLFLSFLSLLLVLVAALAVAGGYAIHVFKKEGPLDQGKIVLIESGSGVGAIADTLAKENVIEHPLVFKIAARFGDSLKAGEYQFQPKVSMRETLAKIESGDVFERKITIPEGLTVRQIISRLNERSDLEGEIADLPPEGSLLPDTYHFVGGETREDVVKRMQRAMAMQLDKLWQRRADDLPFETKAEAITLASIVEKETAVPGERARIAGVFVNRLKAGIPLQTDPTVIYALTKGDIQEDGQGPLGRRLLKKDLQVNSPYNTYKNIGLPPGPIANPGAAALEAALNPEEHNYIFFVADGTGGHAFASTLEEHNRNVAKWRKVRRSQQ
jgi:UPF0755 protein